MTSARFFIRNDDVWTLDREFRYFFDLAIEYKIPVIHAVIPGKMDEQTIRFLCRAKAKNPQLLDIVQHGWMHTNYSKKIGTKYEFGPLRSLKNQRQDIQQGLRKMRQAFGEYFTPAFVPPYHGYDQCTLQILQEENFQLFSVGMRRIGKKMKFLELPAEISFSQYGPGQPRIRSAKGVLADLAKSIHHQSLSGVLTHHSDFSNAISRKELRQFFGYMAALKSKEGWRAQLFSDVLFDKRV